ncbi:MAG: thioredoxin family protein [Candidatus Hydrogenedentes bacterium]|nr:thioredoxin family protein [Candidatus Hydrogenedentota bacterium]
MPRPPVLPTINWKSVFHSGKDYAAWLAGAEERSHARKMEEARKQLALEPHVEAFLAAVPRPVHVIAIAEDWCGDVVRHVPVLQRLAEAGPNVKLRFITREQHPDVFVRFLTNGGEAIPKFVFLSDQFVECGNWGPMPDLCRELISRGKGSGDVGAARKKVSAIYDSDLDRAMAIEELVRLIGTASCTAP